MISLTKYIDSLKDKLSKSQEEIENLNSSISIEDTEFVLKKLRQRKI